MWNHNLDSYNYELPDERIAKFPLENRDESKLLYFNNEIDDREFKDLVDVLPSNALLVFNNTKVIPARLVFHKNTGARIEIFCLEPISPIEMTEAMTAKNACVWKCMIGNSKRFKAEDELTLPLENGLVLMAKRAHDSSHIQFSWKGDATFSELLEMAGRIPLPPYLNRDAEKSDIENYQTVYAEHKGAVAAPTAGLHFTDNILASIKEKGIKSAFVTLHVGAGTFQPVKVSDVREHNMHGEHFIVSKQELEAIANHNGPVIPVGTTSMRTLESIYHFGKRILAGRSNWNEEPIRKLEPYGIAIHPSRKEAFMAVAHSISGHLKAATEIMIMPGYQFGVCDALITNFHQPGSTLIMLVAAFIGEDWRKIYEHALLYNYRFLSYGDSSLLCPLSKAGYFNHHAT